MNWGLNTNLCVRPGAVVIPTNFPKFTNQVTLCIFVKTRPVHLNSFSGFLRFFPLA